LSHQYPEYPDPHSASVVHAQLWLESHVLAAIEHVYAPADVHALPSWVCSWQLRASAGLFPVHVPLQPTPVVHLPAPLHCELVVHVLQLWLALHDRFEFGHV
jgi:hypothetical protein